MLYFPYSDYLKQKYGEKVYKAPVHLPLSCPNRDGTCSTGGCIFCPPIAAGFENLPADKSVREQLRINMDYIGSRYNAHKFIAYFQNYTNTYLPDRELVRLLSECDDENIVEISFSTRPDCLTTAQLSLMKNHFEETGVPVTIELGLQSVNYKTLQKINRGHTLAEFIDAAQNIKNAGLSFGAHIILNLPWDDLTDCIEGAKILSVLGADSVKLHSLYILHETEIAKMLQNKEFSLGSKEDYFERLAYFLAYTNPNIAVQRLFARAPKEDALFVSWNTSWWKLKDEFLEYMKERSLFQGKYYQYRNGSAVRKKFE